MKKVLSFFMCISLILGVLPLNVTASEIQTKYIQISVNGNMQTYECLWNEEEIFCTVENLAEITDYDIAQIEDDLEYEYFRNHEEESENTGIELQTKVVVKVADNNKSAEIEAMHESYSMNCCVTDENVYLPLEKMLYLLHATWMIQDDVVVVSPMPFTILDFMAVYNDDLSKMASKSEDVLIDTGWLFSTTTYGQAVYSCVAEVFNDIDEDVFKIWIPGEGNAETLQCYENAILQMAKDDEDFVGEDIQKAAFELVMDLAFNNEYSGSIQSVMSLPGNVDDLVQSIPDAVSVLEDAKIKSEKLKKISDKIESGEIDTLFLDIPELQSKVKKLGEVGDGLAILQCVWDAYQIADRVKGWDEEYLEQLQILADYENPEYVSDNVSGYINNAAQNLIDSYNTPEKAAFLEAVDSAVGLVFTNTLDASPFGKTISILKGVGSCYGVFNEKAKDTYDVYSELSVVTFSIKIEQLVHEMFKYEGLLTTADKLTEENIKEFRNQLTLYLRSNLRNKAQLYDLNVRGNKDENWANTEEAKELYDEIIKDYAMLTELLGTKNSDSQILLEDNLDNIHDYNPEIKEDILSDDYLKNMTMPREGYYRFYDEQLYYELIFRNVQEETAEAMLGAKPSLEVINLYDLDLITFCIDRNFYNTSDVVREDDYSVMIEVLDSDNIHVIISGENMNVDDIFTYIESPYGTSEEESFDNVITKLSADEIYSKLVEYYAKGTEDCEGEDMFVVEGEFEIDNLYHTSVQCGVPGNGFATQMLYDISVNPETGEVTQIRYLTDGKITKFYLN